MVLRGYVYPENWPDFPLFISENVTPDKGAYIAQWIREHFSDCFLPDGSFDIDKLCVYGGYLVVNSPIPGSRRTCLCPSGDAQYQFVIAVDPRLKGKKRIKAIIRTIAYSFFFDRNEYVMPRPAGEFRNVFIRTKKCPYPVIYRSHPAVETICRGFTNAILKHFLLRV